MKQFLERIFNQNNISYKINSSDTWLSVEKCPYCLSRGHSHNDRYKLYINLSSPVYYCHRCKAQGYLMYLFKTWGIEQEWIKYIVESTGGMDALFISNKYDDDYDEDAIKLTQKDFAELKNKYEQKNNYYRIAKQYLESRGFDFNFVRDRFVFMTAQPRDPFSKQYFGRFLIPDITYTGFTARDFLNTWNPEFKLRYMSSDYASVFGGIVNKNSSDIYIVEGPLDAFKNLQLGFNSLGVGGKSKYLKLFETQKDFLNKFNIIYVIESDVSFQEKAVQELFNYLGKNYKSVFYIDLNNTPFKDTADINNIDDFIDLERMPISQSGYMAGKLSRALNVLRD